MIISMLHHFFECHGHGESKAYLLTCRQLHGAEQKQIHNVLLHVACTCKEITISFLLVGHNILFVSGTH